MLLVTINEWISTLSIIWFDFFSKVSILHLWYPKMVLSFWMSVLEEIPLLCPFTLTTLWPRHSVFSPSLPFSSKHTHTHTRSHYRCYRGDGGHLIVFCPGLQVLQGVEGGVVQAEWVRLQWLAQRLLESFLLKLQHQPVGLLPFSLPLLCSLSPGWKEETKESKGGFKTNIMFLFMAIVHSIDLYHVPERFSSVLCFNKETMGFSPSFFLYFLNRHHM